jgi:enoyl-CoA hydratase/carnithine racemase
MSTPQPLVLSETDSRGVVTLTLNRPEAFNALSEGLLAALQAALDRVAADERVRVVVIAAAGRAFCAGHDLKEMRAEPTQAYYERLFAQCGRMMMTIQKMPVPVVARVQGIATAAGCQLVAMCDLAVAARGTKFAVSGVNLGLFCSTPSVALSRNLPRKAAFEMLVTGDFIDADEARARGLVNRVAEPAELDAEIERLVARIVAKPKVALAMGKQLF